ncbi:hypothetical protein OSB04_017272 [Centaurea solstitialis]|uniref:Uncharacterized protein n=1 Tax=Centaurea solstitialis TaxID=347529 RepID=A0AA38TKP2_9ASTR|nr:hypothetical protein OSB04_017272 [Centaurea solstitialis]
MLGVKSNILVFLTTTRFGATSTSGSGNFEVKHAWVGVVPGWVTPSEVSHQVARNKSMRYTLVKSRGKADIVVETTIEAYKQGLNNNSRWYLDLTKYPAETFEDVKARSLAHMSVLNIIEIMQYLKLSSYGFKLSTKDLVETLKIIESIICWPKKGDRLDDKKDLTKWCDFNDDHG